MNNPKSATRLAAARGHVCAAVLLGALVAPAALADARPDAKRHFREGMSLITAGDVEGGIAELKQAYAIKPHPDVLYDIAKAYVDLGNISQALDYFRQYVATDPADKEQVLSVMQRLQAAIAPAASATAKPVVGRKESAKAAPAQQEEDMFEPETISAKTRATAREIVAELSGAHETSTEDIFEEQVVTASARSSSETKSPASLTVISGDEIRLSGAATIPEILRRVQGIDIAEMNPSDTNVSIRGFNRRLANKVLVLVDGRSVYQDFLGGTFWPVIDVDIQNIDRIEVIRGPGSALYGANAFSGVVNIITRTGEEVSGARAFVQAGDHRTLQGGITTGGRMGKLTYRTTFAYDRADKWTRDFTDGRVDLTPQFAQQDRSREIQRAEAAVSYDVGKARVSGGGGFDNLAIQVVPLGALRTFGAAGPSGFVRLEGAGGQTRLE